MKNYLFLIVLILITSCKINNEKENLAIELDDLFSKEFLENEPGGSILVNKGESNIFLKSYGLANLETKEKNTPNTLFNVGSISKTIVAYGILQLVEEKKINLDDPIDKFFTEFDNPEISKKIQIRHLLSHSSGLPDNRWQYGDSLYYLTAKDFENFEPIKKVEKLKFNPGEKFEYSNPTFNGLALIIEKVTNMKWQDYIKEKIFNPAQMEKSTITDGAHPEKGVSHAYIKKDNDYIEADYGETPMFAASGNGGVWSSVLELAKYEKAIKNNIFLSKDLIEKSRNAFIPENWADTSKPFIGYSWFLDQESLFKEKNLFDVNFVYHTGSQGGFLSFYIVIPEKDILFIALFNRPTKNFRHIIKESINLFKKYNFLD